MLITYEGAKRDAETNVVTLLSSMGLDREPRLSMLCHGEEAHNHAS